MKNYQVFFSFILLILITWYSFYSLMPSEGTTADVPETEFSTERALVPLKEISKAPHYLGTKAHDEVRAYLVSELKKLGLEPELQEGYVLNPSWGTMDKPINILARIKGAENGKALLVFSHYDSALVPSYGASDAGSGVVTILESLRAYQASGKQPKNDIIILFTDAEEVGLDGAELFVNEHPWASDVGVALNFEARGSGGPSNMIIETNHGNAGLIKGFKEAKVPYPLASSLMYSIYKMLPNDTDSTVLREDGDIDGFFFAFIDDHFDYHTANDNYENLDRNSLQHQGSYLLPLMHYYGDANLNEVRADHDDVYFNFPLVKMISYPFDWILPMLLLAAAVFLLLIFYGVKNGVLSVKGMAWGFVPLLSSLIFAGLIGYFGWALITKIYPHYDEIQHGFKYNGHTYIAAFVLLIIALLFLIYHKAGKKTNPANLIVAPIFFWLIIHTLIYLYLEGAAYFILPTYFALLSLWIMIRQKAPNIFLMLLLAIPAIMIFAPLIQFFPVGLGSDHVFISCIFTVLLFGLLLPVVGFYKLRRFLSLICFILAVSFFISAHVDSYFSEKRQKPNSLVYYQDRNENTSYWLTYDKILDDWTKGYLGDQPEAASKYVSSVAGSKYKTGYSFAAEAPNIKVPELQLIKHLDTMQGNERNISFTLLPNRNVNQLSIYADSSLVFNKLSYNNKKVAQYSSGLTYKNRPSHFLLRFYVTDNDSLKIDCTLPAGSRADFTVLEYSFDLLENELFTITQRPAYTMPKPFVVTDAVVAKKTFQLDDYSITVKDSLITVPNE